MSFLSKLFRLSAKQEAPQALPEPVVYPRSEHGISRKQISSAALKVLYRLNKAGYAAHLVGGGVRDLLLGHEPKDFDVATDASPEQVRSLFRNCRLIGRRFRLAHVHFGREIIEVATFRGLGDGDHSKAERQVEDGRLLRDNVFGSIEEDAVRRDFTVNAMFYNIADFSVLDFVGGWDDLQQRRLRLIGDPDVRYREDAVRMLRAIRFAGKLGLEIDEKTAKPIRDLAPLLADMPAARLFDEILKLFLSGQAIDMLALLQEFELFDVLFPATARSLQNEEFGETWQRFVDQSLINTDTRILEDRPVTPAFLFAAILWPAVWEYAQHLIGGGEPEVPALHAAADKVLEEQLQIVSIPRRFSVPMREIWTMQPRFLNRAGKRAERLAGHPRFRAAYDFLLLRASVGEMPQDLAQWWTDYQKGNAAPVTQNPAGKKRRRGRRGGRRRRPNAAE